MGRNVCDGRHASLGRLNLIVGRLTLAFEAKDLGVLVGSLTSGSSTVEESFSSTTVVSRVLREQNDSEKLQRQRAGH